VHLAELAEANLRDRFDSFLSAYNRRRTALPDWHAALEKVTGWLGRAVLQPLLGVVPADADMVLIAGGILGLLPLHAAWVHDPSDASKRLYFFDRVRVRHAPTAVSLREAAVAAQRARVDSALLIDDPRPQSMPVGASRVDRETLGAFFNRCETLAGDAATPQAVLDAMGAAEHGVIHLSCHAQADRGQPLDTAFLLAGTSKLTARDLSGTSALPIRLAVLAGCETGVVGSNLPDELLGLPTALVAAGVVGVISSAWAIRDHPVTAVLLARFYELWRVEGHVPAEALRRAQRWVRDTTNAEKARRFPSYGESFKGDVDSLAHRLWRSTAGHSHPYWWAGFTYSGV
jgi:CHAT domain-containing protein